MSDHAKNDQDLELVKRHAQQLMEHFDSVQIFVARNAPEQDGSLHIEWGDGNWFTRYGQIHAWQIREDERLRAAERRAD